MKDTKKESERFIKNVGREISFYSVKEYIEKKGFCIYYLGTQTAIQAIDRLSLEEVAAARRSFIHNGKEKAVFLDGGMCSHEKLYSLLHEIGHFELGHLEKDCNAYEDDYVMEAEADRFADLVMAARAKANNGGNFYRNLFFAFLFVLSIATIIAGIWAAYRIFMDDEVSGSNSGTDAFAVAEPVNADVSDTVYITPSGGAYHKEECVYAEGGFAVSRKEVAERYVSCFYCRP